jgi:hypothetical protein
MSTIAERFVRTARAECADRSSSPANDTHASSWPIHQALQHRTQPPRTRTRPARPRRRTECNPVPDIASPDPSATTPRRAGQRIPARRVTNQVSPVAKFKRYYRAMRQRHGPSPARRPALVRKDKLIICNKFTFLEFDATNSNHFDSSGVMIIVGHLCRSGRG